jgi:hypothetical protein
MPETLSIEELPNLTLAAVGDMIADDWGDRMYFGAVPYVQAIRTARGVQANEPLSASPYLAEDLHTVVTYLLSNLRTWRGPTARAVKRELGRRLQIH